VITHSIAGLELNGTVTLGQVQAPEGVTIIGDPDLVIAAIRTSRGMMAADASDELELETEVVGEEAQAEAEGATADEAEAAAGGE
jgi:hypothetical protein